MKNEDNRYVAFLRGINVGGRKVIRMEELQHLFEDAGCSDVRTLIQRRFGFPNLLVEKKLMVSATTRNWNTIRKVREMMEDR